MGEKELQLPHRMTLDQRKKLSVTGVSEVVSFDDTAVVLRTHMGILVVQGPQLQMKTLSVEGGQVAVEGTISSLHYEESRSGGGWLRRLVGK